MSKKTPDKKSDKKKDGKNKEEEKKAPPKTEIKGHTRPKESKDPSPFYKMMKDKLTELYNVLKTNDTKVTHAKLLAAVYSYYINDKPNFYSFIKYIEEYAYNRGWKWDEEINAQDLWDICMPVETSNIGANPPDPVEVMLFFEMIDKNRDGVVRVDDLSIHLADIDWFVGSNWDYENFLVNKRNYANNAEKHKKGTW